MRRSELILKLVPHRRIREQIVALTRQQPGHRNLVILIGLDSELAAVMTIRNKSFVQLLNREREREVLGVPVADVAHQPMKYAV